ncbi:MAG: beta-ketoacyl synthase N-terminal-like domain-containing protein [Sandaracinaceae bacterium]
MAFSPIAIVGRACLLPGAHTPGALFDLARQGRDQLRDAPPGRWRARDEDVVTDDPDRASDQTWTRRGGYVEGFHFDPSGFAVPADALLGLDPLVHWVVDTSRRALVDAGALADTRTGAVLGNLSLPSSGQSRFAEQTWLGAHAAAAGVPPTDPRDRFNSGLPALMLARALGLGRGAYALDAACASSLYAIELACRELQAGRADRMLAGAVNRADDLFIHVGFCALGAMSRSGQSRPFHAEADGLVAGEGCGMVVLERLEDAVRAGRTIHGVIRGVGLCNDGRGKGLLAPSARGQARSMQLAFEQAGMGPSDIAYVECHATGTTLGDATELSSMQAAYGDADIPIGSLKANLGHLVTAAGVAGLIKVLESMREGVFLPTPHLDRRSPALDASPFEALDAPRPWQGPRRAGVSAFGFGGNDAHLIVEAHEPTRVFATASPSASADVVVVGLGARVGAGQSAADFARALYTGGAGAAREVRLPMNTLRFPPNDLRKTSAQQTMLLAAALEATEGLTLPSDRTGVFVGYQCDNEISRWGARWRAGAVAQELGHDITWADTMRDALIAPLEAPHVVGVLPNIPANRLSSQFDFTGPSFTTSSEEASGLTALRVAVRALERGDLEAALVGAVDRSAEPVHETALRALGVEVSSGDAAVSLVLRRRQDALRDGQPVLASIELDREEGPRFESGLPRAHAAHGLVELAGAIVVGAGTETPRHVAITPLFGEREVITVTPSADAAFSGPFPDPCLSLPAHLPRVTLPFAEVPSPSLATPLPSSAAPAAPSVPMQTMSPAPKLPPTDYDAPAAPPRPALSSPASASPPAASPAAATPAVATPAVANPAVANPTWAPSPGMPAHPVSAAMPYTAAPMPPGSFPLLPVALPGMPASPLQHFAEHQLRLADAHRHFLAQQAAVHQRFLATFFSAPPVPQFAPPQFAPSQFAPPQFAPPQFAPPQLAPPQSAPPQSAPPQPAPSSAHVAAPTVPTHLAPPPAASPPVSPVQSAPVAAPAPRARASEAPASPPPSPPVPAARVKPAAATPLALRPRGPSFAREDLEVHASGQISRIFGPLFAQQDEHAVQVRMPEPPLLLADRCTGIDAEPGSQGTGTCWTETDVTESSWYLHDGYMPTGVMIESGQADLFLISYLGADFLNRGERAYRLLGCEMTWQGDLPTLGETLAYDIHVDGHAAQGDVRLFFFHYDCHIKRPDGTSRPALQVRHGQAGFFTKEELDDSAGILWTPESQEIVPDARVDGPSVPLEAGSYTREQIEAFAGGRPWDCFGDGFRRSRSHTRTPRIQGGRMLFLDTIELDPAGGPWGRGYLKAVTPISPDDWFFEGHFKNDPCMPGTLMLEGCVQAMAFYLSAMGYTVEKDGWRFQPIPHETYSLRCRGQVVPTSKELTYEVFVEECHDGPVPRLYADLLCTVDGLGAFHARRFGIELTPSWPLTDRPALVAQGANDPRAATASYQGGEPFCFDYPSLLACAWGKPSDAFGPMYERFDGHRRPARLPGPPYHFLTRVTNVEGEIGGLEVGTKIEVEYEFPEDEWYFEENGARVMPFAVLLEAALQPCGWLASYVGSALTIDSDLLFRNLDGKGTIKAEVFPTSGTFRSEVVIKSISQSGGMIIESFGVRCFVGDVEVYELDTVFGFFPPSAFVDQAGLPTSDAQRALFDAESNVDVDLTQIERYGRGTLRIAAPMLRMIDRVSHMDLTGGEAGLGALRAEKTVDPDEWFFKAHFYQDPVQPGSLGIEAMLQLLQFYMLEAGLDEGMKRPRFEGIATDMQHVWKYRGQVVPDNGIITSTMEILEAGRDDQGAFAVASASLWVDGKRIYEAPRLGMRIVQSEDDPEERLDPKADTWVSDHCPTYTRPALPMMSMADRMMAAARADRGDVHGLTGLTAERWLIVDGETRIKTEVEGDEVRLLVWRDAARAELSRFEVAARAKIGAPGALEPLDELGDTTPLDPYADDRLFHGPAFHYVTALRMGEGGASATLDPKAGRVPRGTVHPGLLDAATHAIPHDRLYTWSERISDDVIGYPHRLDVRFDGPPPRDGEVRCEARFVGFDDDERFPVFRLELSQDGRVFADMRLVEVLMPKGPLGRAPSAARGAFLRDYAFVEGVGLSRHEEGQTVLDVVDVATSNWFPGTLEHVYGAADPVDIAKREHVGAAVEAHPGMLMVSGDTLTDPRAPLTAHPVAVDASDTQVIVRSDGPSRLDITPVAEFWRDHFGVGAWPVEDLYYGLVERFVGSLHIEDPRAFSDTAGRSVLYLGNHQTGIESLIFSIVASALQGTPTLTLAKTEHRTSWLGRLIGHCFTWPRVQDPGVIAYFDRTDPTSLPRIVKDLASTAQARSLMVHVEGTRAQSARHRVEKMSGVFCDLAIEAGMPIVPVRFSGGLPVSPSDTKLEYPLGMGRQDYWLGTPIDPQELAAVPYKERIERVVNAIGGLGPSAETEEPLAPDPEFAVRVAQRIQDGAHPGMAALVEVLAERESVHPAVRSLLDPGAPAPSDDAQAAWVEGLASLVRSSD